MNRLEQHLSDVKELMEIVMEQRDYHIDVVDSSNEWLASDSISIKDRDEIERIRLNAVIYVRRCGIYLN